MIRETGLALSLILTIMACVHSHCFAQAAGPADAGQRAGAGAISNPKPESARLEAAIDAALRRHGQPLMAALWLGGMEGPARVDRNAFEIMPSASAIKTCFLVEFFAAHGDALDAPVAAADVVLADDGHPAISHFTAAQKQDIRDTLKGASARKIGEIMMGSAPASNAAYNAAANLVTACLGGPAGLTRRIQARDPAFARVFVRRYMLRDRQTDGDNEMTARALAAVYRMLAAGELPGIDPDTTAAIRNAIVRKGDAAHGFEYVKTGALDSDPLTRVEAGWLEPPGKRAPVVFVVMLRQEAPGTGQARADAGKQLAATCSAIQRLLAESASE